ncbi:PP2C family protein-serine/threonine phosphatase [Promicromonospora thailandica]|uniref:Response regulator receiver domain-containing protein n=1 Tax=Promicromonospora thailandica TaxID=765201 RepID=A0A9X2FZD9_9MICO|nr:SpoIIE family protein phosphatase [Promicromonospora thailandica]MCP2263969.1 Response regulator receiver domain-containing protein [Promicromonospora thailandica]BFF17702.1 SpoIIE family protein phosphatase [Promicromonospora thailandica]
MALGGARSAGPRGGPGGPSRASRIDGPISVLLVEDDDADAFLVGELLADADVEADLRADLHRARSIDEALGILSMVAVDCLLLDLGLPDGEGLGALRRVIEGIEVLPEQPAVVVLTGNTAHDLGAAAVANGADDYLVKADVDGDALARCLRYATLRRRSAAQQIALFRSEVRAAETTRLERALLPKELVTDDRVSVMVGYLPGGNGLLGGDFFDTVERPDGTLVTVIGDVAGHGPDEAALGAAMRTAWRTLVLADTPAPDVLPLLERVLLAERGRPEVFVTICQMVISPDRRRMDVYLAGHPPPLLVVPQVDQQAAVLVTHRCEELSAARRGRALGIPVDGGWEAHTVDLPEVWTAVLYTDGLVEAAVGADPKGTPVLAPSAHGRMPRLGAHGLRSVVEREMDQGTDEVVTRVLRRVRELHGGPLVDDAALLFVGWAGAGATGPAERTSTLADAVEWSEWSRT